MTSNEKHSKPKSVMIAAMAAAIVSSMTAAFSQAPSSLEPTAQAPAAPFFDDQLEFVPVVPDPLPPRVHADAAPEPAPTATPTTRPRTQTGTSSGRSASWAAGQWSRFPAWVEEFALCVAHHESWHSGLWKAENPVSSASGAFQFIDSTWSAWARRAGVAAPRHASAASASTQAYVFAYGLINHGGRRAWHGTNCPGT